jgi:exopolyphosphatase/guanosine-5'-triphosphate,3'-diphosphate pyrophosphatase
MRVAAIDQGTNTTRLLVADVADGRVDEVLRRTEITGLGEGVDGRRRLLPLPIARVRNCLADYRRELERLGAERALVVATSAVRDAENGEAFLGELEWSYGFKTRLLTGDDEAELSFRGVATGRELESDTLVVDLGGGSTELIVGSGREIVFHTSLDIGSVRLTERFLHGDPPAEHELDACAAAVRSALEPLEATAGAGIGVAGTMTSIAALDLGLEEYDRERVHRHRLTIDGVETQLYRLAAMTTAERRELPAFEPKRAPVIVAGAVILHEVMKHFGLAEIEISERDILDGAALEAAKLPEPEEGAAPPGAYTCC